MNSGQLLLLTERLRPRLESRGLRRIFFQNGISNKEMNLMCDSATIAGKIRKEKIIAGQSYYYDAVDEDVYLIYGSENTFYDDDIKTSFDGSFEFNYLEKGNYQFFVYSDCNSCLSGDTVLIQDVVISDKKERVDLGTITIQ